MAVKEIVRTWDNDRLIEENIDFLKQRTKKVQFPLTEKSRQIIQDLIDSYRATPCAGIAANQLGYDKSIFVGMREDIEVEDPEQDLDDVNPRQDNCEVYINPQIDRVDDQSTQRGSEGCLSLPGLTLFLERYDKIKVRYYNVEGKAVKKPLKGFISRLFQHELDHLKGNLMFETALGDIGVEKDQDQKQLDQLSQLMKYLQKK
ncbi:MAG: hypothetical protein CBD58_04005 [bacterium TMED198]|nr:MAG: hypothetical protein CBD58_04005 [bacterium TMED198]